MMEEIGSAMKIAGRIGYEVGRQWQVDRVINEWVQHSNNLTVQRNEAWRHIELGNARIVELKKENAQLLEDLNHAQNQLKLANKALAVRDGELRDAKLSADVGKRTVKVLRQEAVELRRSENERRQEYAQRLESVKAWGRTWMARRNFIAAFGRADLQILRQLTMEIKRACPNLQLPSLDASNRKKIRMQAWEDGGGTALGEKFPSDSYLLN